MDRKKQSLIEVKLDKIVRLLCSIDRKTGLVSAALMHGEDRAYPWHRLNCARQRQVLAVREYLEQHRTRTVRFAAKCVYAPVGGGYPSWQALAAYCYHIRIEHYVGGMPR